VPDDHRIDAADVLVRESSGGMPSAGRRFLANARLHSISLDHFWMSVTEASPLPRQACLIVPGAGRTGMVFISSPKSKREIDEVASLIEHAGAGAPQPILAQALLDAHETRERARRWSDIRIEPDHIRLPEGIEMRIASEAGANALARALESSYEDTLDCPELHGLRNIDDVIESHRSTGEHDPSLWWVLLEQGEPRGALLLNPQGHAEGIELVYLGMAPSLRGRGIASRVFLRGIQKIAIRSNRTLTCAVDANNAPAIEFYSRFGFEAFQSREAYIRAYR
jgi:ribosomal protein S18 acetylase RimI-like enzyme